MKRWTLETSRFVSVILRNNDFKVELIWVAGAKSCSQGTRDMRKLGRWTGKKQLTQPQPLNAKSPLFTDQRPSHPSFSLHRTYRLSNEESQ
jgi:hypothetical protein